MSFGVTDEGFVIKRFEDLVPQWEKFFSDAYGIVNTDSSSAIGQLINILAKNDADTWELLEAVYNSQYKDSATGLSLDNVASLIGITRQGELSSTANLLIQGTQGTLLTIGKVISTTETTRFITTAAASIDIASAAQAIVSVDTVLDTTLYTVTINGSAITFLSDGDATNLEIAAGLVAAIVASTQPVTPSDNLDGTFQIDTNDFSVPYSLAVDANLSISSFWSTVPAESEEAGAVAALANSLTEIKTPVSGWTAVTNPVDAVVGQAEETDSELRLRMAQSQNISSAATIEAIIARLLNVSGVTGATVIENPTDVIDGEGRPPHSFEAIVTGGTDPAVANEIWLAKGGGIETFGNLSEIVPDSQGFNHTISFSRATEIFCHLRITLTLNSEEAFPVDGATQITDDVVSFGNTLVIGEDVILQKFVGEVYKTPGISTALIEIATSATAGGAPGAFQTTNLTIAAAEQARFDSARVTVITP